jgi:hypothetical protein
MRCRLGIAAACAALAAACAEPPQRDAGAPVRTPPLDAARPVSLVSTPDRALRRCLRSSVLRPACPRAVPPAAYERPTTTAAVYRRERGFPETFDLQAFAPTRPRLVHVVVQANAHHRVRARAERVGERLLAPRRRVAIVIGERTWNGRAGRLSLAPPYPTGGIVGDHLVFRWREGGVRYDVTLHVWKPIDEAIATLEAIVGSLHPVRAR